MADYTLTSSSVAPSSSAKKFLYTAGATIGAGQPCYLDNADLDANSRPKAKLADANASATTAAVRGIAANSASAGQPIYLITEDDDYTHGLASPAVGDVVVLSATAGGLAPASDVASGWRPVVLMVPISSTKAIVRIVAGTVAKT